MTTRPPDEPTPTRFRDWIELVGERSQQPCPHGKGLAVDCCQCVLDFIEEVEDRVEFFKKVKQAMENNK